MKFHGTRSFLRAPAGAPASVALALAGLLVVPLFGHSAPPGATTRSPQPPPLPTRTSDTPFTPGPRRAWRAAQDREGSDGHDDTVRRGELIVAASRVDASIAVFRAAFDSGFRIHRMDNPNLRLGDDEAMMAANDTSAFNCRAVTGNPSRLSPHSYATAFDVNPRRNPYKAANDVWHLELR